MGIILGMFSAQSRSANRYISDYFFTYVDSNREIAMQYLLQNADKISDAAYMLGLIYLQLGQLELAEKFLLKAGNKDFPPAINALGDLYYSDKQDIEMAKKYYEKAAKLGYGPAQFNIGIVYLKHLRNHKKARYWLTKAYNNKKDLCLEIRQDALSYRESMR